MKVLVIIPAFNEEESIMNTINSLKNSNSQIDYCIINDCSTDGTELVCKTNKLNYISLPSNLGIGGGVQTGYKYAFQNNYDIAIQIDGDGQHNPLYIPNLIQPIENCSADMVIGSRFIEKEGFQSTSARKAGIRLLKNLIFVCCGVKINDPTSGFRACNKEMIEFFAKNYAQDYPEPEAIIAAKLKGFNIIEVPVIMSERQGGKSSIDFLKSIYYMIKVSLAIIVNRFSKIN